MEGLSANGAVRLPQWKLVLHLQLKTALFVTPCFAFFVYHFWTYKDHTTVNRSSMRRFSFYKCDLLSRLVEYLCDLISGRHKGKQLSTAVNEKDKEIWGLQDKNRQLEAQLEDYTQRLSAEMGTKVAANESSVENVGIINRPMNVAEEYSQLCSQEWLDAKELCDDKCQGYAESQRMSLLYNIIMIAEKEANFVFDQLFLETEMMLENPFKMIYKQSVIHSENKHIENNKPANHPYDNTEIVTENGEPEKDIVLCYANQQMTTEQESVMDDNENLSQMTTEQESVMDDNENLSDDNDGEKTLEDEHQQNVQSLKSENDKTKKKTAQLPLELTNAVGDHLRKTANEADLTLIQQVFENKFAHLNDDTKIPVGIWNTVQREVPVKVYINAVLRLAWKMVIQRPKMKFEGSNKWLKDTYQDLHWGSVNPVGREEASYHVIPVFPMLYHGNQFMVKGKVLLEHKDNL